MKSTFSSMFPCENRQTRLFLGPVYGPKPQKSSSAFVKVKQTATVHSLAVKIAHTNCHFRGCDVKSYRSFEMTMSTSLFKNENAKIVKDALTSRRSSTKIDRPFRLM